MRNAISRLAVASDNPVFSQSLSLLRLCSSENICKINFCLSDGHLLVLSMPVVFFLGRSSKRMVVTANMTILVKIPVHLPEVELVRLYFLWQHAVALFIEFQLRGEVGRLVVGVPTEIVDVGETVHDAGANLRSELDLGFRLALDNGTEVRLVDADDADGASADVLVKYLLLLRVHLERRLETLAIKSAEAREETA